MIFTKLKGRLGNQMFQFAAAFSASQRLGSRMIFSGSTASRRLGLIGSTLLRNDHLENIKMNGLLWKAFGVGPNLLTGRIWEISEPFLRSFMKQEYSPPRIRLHPHFDFEKFDEEFFSIPKYTRLNGWFQSERYFENYENQICNFFYPRKIHTNSIHQLKKDSGIGSTPTVGIHVRRGDYLRIQNFISDPTSGWALGRDYFMGAVETIGPGYNYAIFSDDPDWASEAFRPLNPWVSRDRDPVVDLFALSECQYIVSSNSSFSWWAGWLGQQRGSTVYAPKYHLGWKHGIWIPDGIQTNGFLYLDVPGAASEV